MDSVERFCHEKKDRISELPRNVMDTIFKEMPIRYVVRTSILSRKWRYIWASYPKLVFDNDFFKELVNIESERSIQDEFTKAIGNVLLVHSGPILELFLHIPMIRTDLSPEINQWMLFLSRNGIKKLELWNANSKPYILPSCICSCSSLIDLNVRNCIMKEPYEFKGFQYLVQIKLQEVSFSANLFLKAPLLECLIIDRCTGVEHISISAPRLNVFCILGSDYVDWQWVASNKQLTHVAVGLGMEVKNVDQTMNMIQFLKRIRKVMFLWMDGYSLKYLAEGKPSKRLATTRLPFLTMANLRDFGVDDFEQISSALCLLKNCPNLNRLELEFAASTSNVVEPVAEYLEPLNCMDVKLDKLQTVTIKSIKGLKVELLLIKFLLARSTCLQRMIIQHRPGTSASDGFKISRELLGFPRASSNAKILYADAPGS